LDKTFGQTATSRKEVNEPYRLPLSVFNGIHRAYDILPLATWQGVMSNIVFLLSVHPSRAFEQKGAPLGSGYSARPAAGIVAELCPPWCFKHGTSNYTKTSRVGA
jgi:hypothetical protein